MLIEPIAYFESPFSTKFGIPRQSGIVEQLTGRIVMAPGFRNPEALRGLDDYDYVWLIWGFSENVESEKHPTVRPPLLGGNERVGVWASRSPFRPNNLGLSSVRLLNVDMKQMTIEVAGADLMDGTPVYDIKPYLAYVDSHPQARGGFTDKKMWKRLAVVFDEMVADILSMEEMQVLSEVLSLDPRPHYHDDAEREYGMPFRGWDVIFKVQDEELRVVRCTKR